MPDLFSDITKAPPDVLEAIVKPLELRAADPQLQSMLESYLSETELPEPSFMFSSVERGTDALMASGRLGEEGAIALKAEAERRVEAEQWYGQISYASVISRKPG